MKNARQLAAQALMRVDEGKAYSNIVIDRALEGSGLDNRDKAFATALFYGVLERRVTLDWVIGRYSKLSIGKMSPAVRALLREAVYQIACMDGIPASAAVNEAVELTRAMGQKNAAGFVNGVLRSFLRDGGAIELPQEGKDRAGRLSLAYSVPRPLVKLWENQYGRAELELLLKAMGEHPPLYIRVNSLKTTAQELLERWHEAGIEARQVEGVPFCLAVAHSGAVEKFPGFAEGLFHVQDLSSQLCAAALQAGPGMRVLDVCAAPGGKSFTLAQWMENKGSLLAGDLYPAKIKRIEEGAARLGVCCLCAGVRDAALYSPETGSFDRVLCDAPCSGLGIIRRKPEIRYKPLEELKGLPALQYKILETSAKYVKDGGALVYSTCTLNRHENDYLTERFLKEHPEFQPDPLPEWITALAGKEQGWQMTLFPQDCGSDGFYMARFCKSGRRGENRGED
ncbi:MAG: 16S rRNA (cytosine(967)-C(5))-methyltransferase RsmB [Oscillospiraceae bacterium]|nr:16S rRNA (cytosine(967)-C(5))-methyltransferase RsmB [Oscillospiraceae bacterium]